MIVYLPERLYVELMDSNSKFFTPYFNLSRKVESYFVTLKTFEQVVNANPSSDKKIKEYKEELDKLVEEAFKDKPKYIEEYKINNGDYNKQEMISMIVKEEDIENRFFLLSNIINQSFEDMQFSRYLRAYVAFFEVLKDEEKEGLSKYIWLKYMYAKIYSAAYLKPLNSDTFTIFMNLYKTIKKIVNDEDITTNYFLEAINDATRCYLSKAAGRQDYLNVLDFSLNVEDSISVEYQYYRYSEAYINMLDIRNMVYLALRQFTSVYHITARICKYISNAFKDEAKLLRGLAYYDKCNHNNFALIVRKYIKLIDTVPLMHRIKLENISDKDREYFLSDRIGTTVAASSPNKIIEAMSVKDIDNWFHNNENLDDMKDIIVGE